MAPEGNAPANNGEFNGVFSTANFFRLWRRATPSTLCISKNVRTIVHISIRTITDDDADDTADDADDVADDAALAGVVACGEVPSWKIQYNPHSIASEELRSLILGGASVSMVGRGGALQTGPFEA